MIPVKVCERCAPLLKDPKLDTLGRLTARLCGACRLRLAVAKSRRKLEDRGRTIDRAFDDELRRLAKKIEKL